MKEFFAKVIVVVIVFIYLEGVVSSNDGYKNYITVLLYHKFNEPDSPTTSISTELFEKQLKYLRDNNYNVITPLEFYDMLRGKRPIPPKTVLITIDDAYKSVYTDAYPLLKKYKIPFLLFLYMEAVARYPDFMTEAQIKEMLKDENVFFGNHSYSHKRFARWPEGLKTRREYSRWIQDDLDRSLKAFKKLTGYKPLFFAYPYGEYNRDYYNLIKTSGYRLAFTQDPFAANEKTDLHLVPRYAIVGSWARMDRFVEFLVTEPIDIKAHFPDFGFVDSATVNEVRFVVDEIKDYKNMGIYISEVGWLKPDLDMENGVVSIKLQKELERDVNRIGITGFNRRTGRWGRFFYMIIKSSPP